MRNAAAILIDQAEQEGYQDRIALASPAGGCTYAELRDLTDRIAGALRRLGVEPEQRVALLLPDGIAFVAAFFAAIKLGAVAVPLNTRLGEAACRTVLQDCRAKVLVTEPALSPSPAALRDLPLLAVTTFEELARTPALPVEPEPVGDDAMAFWLYTSGTTGFPKAAVHCHRDLLAGHPYGVEVLGATEHDRVFATSKLFFAYALSNALLIPLAVRASVYLHPALADPDLVVRVMRDWRPTLFFSVPTVYARLLRAALPPDTFGSARLCVSAGERLPPEVYEAWRRRFGVEILDGMGATETIFMVLSNRPGQSRPGSSGTPVPGTAARLLDGHGAEVADGGEGVLHVRTPSASPYYWNRIDLSRRTFIGEWFRTGDVYVRDRDGFYHHRGRSDDFFKVAGQWVAPTDVEAALRAHPDVADVGVVGAEEPGGLTKTFAFVVPRDPAAATAPLVRDLAALAERTLPSHQRPRQVFVVPELPRTATGKLQRFLLRAEVPRLLPP